MPKTNCCVPNCPATSTRHFALTFHRLPTNENSRKRWQKLIRNAALKDSRWTSVCGLHFKYGRKTYDEPDPSIFPWSPEWESVVESFNSHMQRWFDSQQQRDHTYGRKPPLITLNRPLSATKSSQPRRTRNSSGCLRVPDIDGQDANFSCFTEDFRCEETRSSNEDAQHSLVEEVQNQDNRDSESQLLQLDESDTEASVTTPMPRAYYEDTYIVKKDELQDLLEHIDIWLEGETGDVETAKRLLRVVVQLLRNYKEQYDTMITINELHHFNLNRFEGSDEDIRFWTGFYSYDVLKIFWLHYVEPNSHGIRYWGSTYSDKKSPEDNCGPKRRLAPIDELFLVLVKLKRGSANKDLGERFGIHPSHVSRIFVTWIQIIHRILSSIEIWISQKKIRKYMPECFKPLYKNVRVIVDCTEIRSERPSDFEVQCATYSSYKSCNTYKALVGISPSGIPTFVSQLYEGSISDNEITNKSNLRDILEPGDAVMADRGWTCANWLAKKGVRLVTPHFLKGKKQMSIPELVESVSLARVRIHVERCMGRIKQWHFLKQDVPLTYWAMISDIFQVCARLVVFWPPLLDEEAVC